VISVGRVGNFAIISIFIILPLNIFESEWGYCKPLSNAALPNERMYPNFAIKTVAMATSLEESKKRPRSVIFKQKYVSFGAKIVKISTVDPEIICLHFITRGPIAVVRIARDDGSSSTNRSSYGCD